ncbi:extensin-like [Homarus americanus]|uniref:extensin-like n=1 Tax=Homarus americanus TaxID=6706 RepID=UPI001C48A043|nr:extensin-like [Homarus americanus]
MNAYTDTFSHPPEPPQSSTNLVSNHKHQSSTNTTSVIHQPRIQPQAPAIHQHHLSHPPTTVTTNKYRSHTPAPPQSSTNPVTTNKYRSHPPAPLQSSTNLVSNHKHQSSTSTTSVIHQPRNQPQAPAIHQHHLSHPPTSYPTTSTSHPPAPPQSSTNPITTNKYRSHPPAPLQSSTSPVVNHKHHSHPLGPLKSSTNPITNHKYHSYLTAPPIIHQYYHSHPPLADNGQSHKEQQQTTT